MKKNNPLIEVAKYYSNKLAEHGETPQGVDWNGDESQKLRFMQLTKVIEQPLNFSLNDLGCGYGAFFEFLNVSCRDFIYNGYDISIDMIQAGRSRFSKNPNAHFSVASEPLEIADYGVSSGIFNVKLGQNNQKWCDYIEFTLDVMNRTSRKGFAFNCLTKYSDEEKMQKYLYYADPCVFFDLCKKRYSRQVALLHDYGLYEFTIIVRKDP